jgi:hypothetical protein
MLFLYNGLDENRSSSNMTKKIAKWIDEAKAI